jgi:hypothetical protein
MDSRSYDHQHHHYVDGHIQKGQHAFKSGQHQTNRKEICMNISLITIII